MIQVKVRLQTCVTEMLLKARPCWQSTIARFLLVLRQLVFRHRHGDPVRTSLDRKDKQYGPFVGW